MSPEVSYITQIVSIVLSTLGFAVTAGFAGVAHARLGKEPGALLTLAGAMLLFLITLSGLLFRYLVLPNLFDLAGGAKNAIAAQQIYGIVYATLNVTAIACLAAGIVARRGTNLLQPSSHETN